MKSSVGRLMRRKMTEWIHMIRDRLCRRRGKVFATRFGQVFGSLNKSFLGIISADATTRDAISFLLRHAAIYYTLSVLGYSFLLDDLSVTDSMYLATVTFTTIGYGDVYPTGKGRLYLIVLASYGIVVLGIFLGQLVRTVVYCQPLFGFGMRMI
jgi:hypothetical protein